MKTRLLFLLKRGVFLVVLLMWFSFTLLAQKQVKQHEYYDKNAQSLVPEAKYILEGVNTDLPASLTFRQGSEVYASEFISWLKNTYKISPEINFQLIKSENDALGFIHQRYIQTYKGIPVDRAEYIAQVKQDRVVSFSGNAYSFGSVTIQPGLSEQAALGKAMDFVGAKEYKWQNEKWEKQLKSTQHDLNATYYPKGILTISNNNGIVSNFGKDNFRLAYRFDIYASSPDKAVRVYVDAISGAILYTLPLESDCEPAVNFTTIFYGTKPVQTEKFTSTAYRLNDDCLSAGIYVRDWGSSTSTASPFDIQNTTNTWTTNNERFGASVVWETKQAYNYYKNVYGRDAYDNSNGDVNGYINAVFSSSGGDYTDNASMSFTGGTLKVGLGSAGTLADSWSALDILAHEYTHAVTGSTAQLTYSNESGALNESFSDIFGEMVENYIFGSNDWLMGNDRTDGAIRSLANPKLYSNPDTYLGTYWYSGANDNGGVHTNSGVQNHWFYLLAVGGSGTNDNGKAFSVSGIGRSEASAIAFRNLTVKLSSGSNYAAARAGAIEAAQDLYGSCSNEVKQVTNAWYAVGVGNPYVGGTASSPTKPGGYNISCNGGSDGAINLSPFGTGPFTFSWSNGPTSQNQSGLGAGDYTVVITDGTGCTASVTIHLSEPPVLSATAGVTSNYHGRDISCAGAADGMAEAFPTGGAPAYSYLWSANTGFQTTKSISGLGPGLYTVVVTDANGCTSSASVTLVEPPPLVANAVATSNYNGFNIRCHGGSDGVAQMNVSGGTLPYSYMWGASAGNQTTKVATNLKAGTYVVTVTDVNGCGNTASVTLNEPPQLNINAGPNQTVYYGYPPAACATLTWSGASGGVPPYTYSWSTGQTSQTITVCPTSTTIYTVTIKDLNNCTFSDDVKICVIDVRCGNKLDKVEICHLPPGNPNNRQTLCVAMSAVATHLAHGDSLGACGTNRNCTDDKSVISDNINPIVNDGTISMEAFPNPFSETAMVKFSCPAEGSVTIKLMDHLGRVVSTLFSGNVGKESENEVVVDGKLLSQGLYFVVLQHSDGTMKIRKLIYNR
jgi:bacillolysin